MTNLHPVTLAADAPPTIVHLFATWCAPCRTELPALADFGRRSKTAMAAYQDHKSMGRA